MKQHVLDELAWEPSVNAAHIGVTARDGVVTLTGHVCNYTEKLAVERATGRVSGVKAVAEDLEVRYLSTVPRLLMKKLPSARYNLSTGTFPSLSDKATSGPAGHGMFPN